MMKHENEMRMKQPNIAMILAALSLTCVGSHARDYPDSRPASTLRVEAKDQGVVLKHGDGPGPCDYPDSELRRDFASPPDSARMWIWWFWLGDKVDKESITADLEALKAQNAVVNLWPNRLAGDLKLPAIQRRTQTNFPADPNQTLLSSGLLGPVRVMEGTPNEN